MYTSAKMLQEINRLLNATRTLQVYETKLSEATGERFNVFEVLRIGSREVTTHSPLLAELLNPQGRHGMGPTFLDVFSKQFSLQLNSPARVEQEHWTGPKGEDSGGRIDIRISDRNGNEVVIENKIYAVEQENQVSRYLKSCPQAKVLFLTLDGRKPDENISSEARKRLACISYTKDILQWLEACRKEAAHAPIVRETIVQYINLIKVLTGQNTNSRMRDQITESVLQNKATLEAYFALVRNQQDVSKKLVAKLQCQVKEIANKCGLQVEFDPDLSRTECGFHLFDEAMKSRNVRITFQLSVKDFRGLQFGISYWEEQKKAFRCWITDQFEAAFGHCEAVPWWAAVKPWQGREDWWNDGTFLDIFSGEFQKEVQQKVEKMAAILRHKQGEA